jgi:nitroreductase
MREFRNAQEEALANAGYGAASEVYPQGTGDKVMTGQRTRKAFEDAVSQLHEDAGKAYDQLGDIARQSTERVQTGETQSPILGPDGKPIVSPVYEELQVPVTTAGAKSAAKPILDRLDKAMPAAQRQASPAYQVLKQIMERPDVVDINTALEDLSAIQDLARLAANDHPALRGKSKGITAALIKPLRAAIDSAAAEAGPEAIEALNRGRELTRRKYEVGAVLDSLPEEPVRLVDALVRRNDTSINALRSVAKYKPDVLPDIGRSVIEGILDQSTADGGFRRVDAAVNAWNRLGPETKKLLYTPEQIQNFNNFFKLAKMMGENPNPSGTAPVLGALGTMGFLLRHPIEGTAVMLTSKQLANLMTGPGGARAAVQAMRTPLASQSASKAYGELTQNGQ